MEAKVRRFLSIYYQRPVEEGETLPLASSAFKEERGRDGQYDANGLLESQFGTCPKDIAACLGVTSEDLYVPSLQYVFGLGHFSQRVGIFSTYRVMSETIVDDRSGASRRPNRVDKLRRALKVAVHELGHEFALSHCIHYRECVMGGTNSLAESDAGRLTLCPLDHQKLAWKLRWDPYGRFAQLERWAYSEGLYDEASYWREMSRQYPEFSNAAGGHR